MAEKTEVVFRLIDSSIIGRYYTIDEQEASPHP
jgi:hypothetical protein